MMKQRFLDPLSNVPVFGSPAFLLFSTFLLLGAIAGSWTGLLVQQDDTELIVRIAAYCAENATGTQGAIVWQSLVSLGIFCLWYGTALLLGRLPLSGLTLPLLLTARGFSLAFAVASTVSRLGTRGLMLSLCTVASGALFQLPALLLLTTVVARASCAAPRGRRHGYRYALEPYRQSLLLTLLLGMAGVGCRTVMILVVAG